MDINYEVIDYKKFNPEEWNSCNHPELFPENYDEKSYIKIKSADYSGWYNKKLDPFLLSPPVAIVKLPPKYRKQLYDLNKLVLLRGLQSRDTETINEILNAISSRLSGKIEKGPYFIRSDECSTKDVHSYFPVPYDTLKDYVKDVVISKRMCSFLDGRSDDEFVVIISKWDNTVDMEKEFRVFVKDKYVTGISQYKWHKPLNWHPSRDDMYRIVSFVNTLYETNLCIQPDITMDVHVDMNSVRLVEMGPFGGHTGCSSCLFHWLRDKDIIYNTNKKSLVVRLLR